MKVKNQRQVWIVVTIGGFLLLIGFWGLRIGSASVPSYDGKTVGEWFEGGLVDPRRAETIEKAEVAFKAIGTNSIPYLIEKARGIESPLNKLYCMLYPLFPNTVRKWIRPATPTSLSQSMVILHLHELHQDTPQILDPYASQLMDIVPSITDNNTRKVVFRMVENSVLKTEDTQKQINYLLSFTNDPSFAIQLDAMILLWRIDGSLTNGIPILTTALTNRSVVGTAFAASLQVGDRRYERAIDNIQKNALQVLTQISPELAKQYEIEE